MAINEERLLEEFRDWIRNQPVAWSPTLPYDEQIGDCIMDYILDFCKERKYSETTEESMLDWIALRNEVCVFFDEQGITGED